MHSSNNHREWKQRHFKHRSYNYLVLYIQQCLSWWKFGSLLHMLTNIIRSLWMPKSWWISVFHYLWRRRLRHSRRSSLSCQIPKQKHSNWHWLSLVRLWSLRRITSRWRLRIVPNYCWSYWIRLQFRTRISNCCKQRCWSRVWYYCWFWRSSRCRSHQLFVDYL